MPLAVTRSSAAMNRWGLSWGGGFAAGVKKYGFVG